MTDQSTEYKIEYHLTGGDPRGSSGCLSATQPPVFSGYYIFGSPRVKYNDPNSTYYRYNTKQHWYEPVNPALKKVA